ncbi:hypothetical protein [Clostridium butyricum]|uniref:hypothetical protein n=1 Tax=Clostridium butyricum TaxID=1492 RepID=UPI0018AA063C|nr:hypothetical protein [Clostridium butyricum]
MKIIISSIEDDKAKVTLDFKGKRYFETWKKNEDGSHETIDECIVSKLESDGVVAENTDLDYLLDQIEIEDFMRIAENEKEW